MRTAHKLIGETNYELVESDEVKLKLRARYVNELEEIFRKISPEKPQ